MVFVFLCSSKDGMPPCGGGGVCGMPPCCGGGGGGGMPPCSGGGGGGGGGGGMPPCSGGGGGGDGYTSLLCRYALLISPCL